MWKRKWLKKKKNSEGIIEEKLIFIDDKTYSTYKNSIKRNQQHYRFLFFLQS